MVISRFLSLSSIAFHSQERATIIQCRMSIYIEINLYIHICARSLDKIYFSRIEWRLETLKWFLDEDNHLRFEFTLEFVLINMILQ
jgi:hypothetical protein